MAEGMNFGGNFDLGSIMQMIGGSGDGMSFGGGAFGPGGSGGGNIGMIMKIANKGVQHGVKIGRRHIDMMKANRDLAGVRGQMNMNNLLGVIEQAMQGERDQAAKVAMLEQLELIDQALGVGDTPEAARNREAIAKMKAEIGRAAVHDAAQAAGADAADEAVALRQLNAAMGVGGTAEADRARGANVRRIGAQERVRAGREAAEKGYQDELDATRMEARGATTPMAASTTVSVPYGQMNRAAEMRTAAHIEGISGLQDVQTKVSNLSNEIAGAASKGKEMQERNKQKGMQQGGQSPGMDSGMMNMVQQILQGIGSKGGGK